MPWPFAQKGLAQGDEIRVDIQVLPNMAWSESGFPLPKLPYMLRVTRSLRLSPAFGDPWVQCVTFNSVLLKVPDVHFLHINLKTYLSGLYDCYPMAVKLRINFPKRTGLFMRWTGSRIEVQYLWWIHDKQRHCGVAASPCSALPIVSPRLYAPSSVPVMIILSYGGYRRYLAIRGCQGAAGASSST